MQADKLMTAAWIDVAKERLAQNRKWGVQRHTLAEWLVILVEEVGELAQAIQQGSVQSKDSDAGDKYKEAIQVSAVALAIAEQIMEEMQKEELKTFADSLKE